MLTDDFYLSKIIGDLDQIDSVDFYFIILHSLNSFPVNFSRHSGAGVEGQLHNGLDFPDSQAVEIFIFVMSGFQSNDVQFLANDTFKKMVYFCRFNCGFVLSGSIGQHLQLTQVIVNHGVSTFVPVEMLLHFTGQVPDFLFIVSITFVFLFTITANQYHADIFVARDAADSGEGFGQMLAFLYKTREFDLDNFHYWVFFLLAVAILFGDEVIKPVGNLVAGEGVEGLQFVPGGLEVVFAGVFEYDIEVAGVGREHLGEFCVFFPFALVLPAGDHVFESGQVSFESCVGLHCNPFLLNALHSISILTLQCF